MPVTGSLTPSSSISTAAVASQAGVDDLRQACARHAEDLEQPVVPVAGAQIHEQRAAGVGDVGDVAAMAGELEQQPAIYRAESKLAALRARARAREPGRAARRAWCRRNTDRAAARCARRSPASRPAARSRSQAAGGAPVLPDDGRRHGFAGGPIPQHRGFTLVGDADGGDVARESRAPARSASAIVARCVSQISSASCSTQPGCGKCCVNSRWASATTRPRRRTAANASWWCRRRARG